MKCWERARTGSRTAPKSYPFTYGEDTTYCFYILGWAIFLPPSIILNCLSLTFHPLFPSFSPCFKVLPRHQLPCQGCGNKGTTKLVLQSLWLLSTVSRKLQCGILLLVVSGFLGGFLGAVQGLGSQQCEFPSSAGRKAFGL